MSLALYPYTVQYNPLPMSNSIKIGVYLHAMSLALYHCTVQYNPLPLSNSIKIGLYLHAMCLALYPYTVQYYPLPMSNSIQLTCGIILYFSVPTHFVATDRPSSNPFMSHDTKLGIIIGCSVAFLFILTFIGVFIWKNPFR